MPKSRDLTEIFLLNHNLRNLPFLDFYLKVTPRVLPKQAVGMDTLRLKVYTLLHLLALNRPYRWVLRQYRISMRQQIL